MLFLFIIIVIFLLLLCRAIVISFLCDHIYLCSCLLIFIDGLFHFLSLFFIFRCCGSICCIMILLLMMFLVSLLIICIFMSIRLIFLCGLFLVILFGRLVLMRIIQTFLPYFNFLITQVFYLLMFIFLFNNFFQVLRP